MVDLDFIIRVLTLFDKYDDHDELWWRCGGQFGTVSFFIKCSDLFWWGCADNEPLIPQNIDQLEQAYKDIEMLKPNNPVALCYATSLFCCRMRGMRPQGCCYPEDKDLWPLVDACGPEREVGIGNPYPPGGRMQKL